MRPHTDQEIFSAADPKCPPPFEVNGPSFEVPVTFTDLGAPITYIVTYHKGEGLKAQTNWVRNSEDIRQA